MFAELILASFIANAGAFDTRPAAPMLQHAVVRETADAADMGARRPELQMAADLGCSYYSRDYHDRCYRRHADPYYGRHGERHGRYDDDRYDDYRYKDDPYKDDRYDGHRYDRDHDYRKGYHGDDRLRDRYGRPYGDEEHRRHRYRRGAYDRPRHVPYRRDRRGYDRHDRGFSSDRGRYDPYHRSGAPGRDAPWADYLQRSSHDGPYYKKKDTGITATMTGITAITTGRAPAGSDAGSTV